MSLADRMDAALFNVDAVLMRTGQLAARKPATVFLFVEDLASKSLYLNCSQSVFGSGWPTHCHACRNRKDVLFVRKEMLNEFGGNIKSLFFIDRDYDFLPGLAVQPAPDLYVTLFYSIESYLADPDFIRVLVEYGICPTFSESFIEEVVAKYQEIYVGFYELLRPMLIWAIACKIGKETVNLNNLTPSKLVDVNDDLELVPNAEAFAEFVRLTVKVGVKPTLFNVLKAVKLTKDMEPRRLIRGKYDSWLVIVYMKRIMKILRDNYPSGERKPYIPITISDDALFSRLVQNLSDKLDVLDFLRDAKLRFFGS